MTFDEIESQELPTGMTLYGVRYAWNAGGAYETIEAYSPDEAAEVFVEDRWESSDGEGREDVEVKYPDGTTEVFTVHIEIEPCVAAFPKK